jgi:hypothetical protein
MKQGEESFFFFLFLLNLTLLTYLYFKSFFTVE